MKKIKTIPNSMGINNADQTVYPYVVVRWMAAVYGKIEIAFQEDGIGSVDGKKIVFVHPEPFTEDGLKPECRDQIIEIVKAMVVRTTRRMCLVLSADNCIFIEPDGTLKTSNEPPSGGVRVDDVKLEKRGEN